MSYVSNESCQILAAMMLAFWIRPLLPARSKHEALNKSHITTSAAFGKLQQTEHQKSPSMRSSSICDASQSEAKRRWLTSRVADSSVGSQSHWQGCPFHRWAGPQHPCCPREQAEWWKRCGWWRYHGRCSAIGRPAAGHRPKRRRSTMQARYGPLHPLLVPPDTRIRDMWTPTPHPSPSTLYHGTTTAACNPDVGQSYAGRPCKRITGPCTYCWSHQVCADETCGHLHENPPTDQTRHVDT